MTGPDYWQKNGLALLRFVAAANTRHRFTLGLRLWSECAAVTTGTLPTWGKGLLWFSKEARVLSGDMMSALLMLRDFEGNMVGRTKRGQRSTK